MLKVKDLTGIELVFGLLVGISLNLLINGKIPLPLNLIYTFILLALVAIGLAAIALYVRTRVSGLKSKTRAVLYVMAVILCTFGATYYVPQPLALGFCLALFSLDIHLLVITRSKNNNNKDALQSAEAVDEITAPPTAAEVGARIYKQLSDTRQNK